MKQTLTDILFRALTRARNKEELKLDVKPVIILEAPREKSHGDLATTLAMTLAKTEGKPPRKIAEIIVSNIQDTEGFLAKTEIAGPGFINFFLKQDQWQKTLFDINTDGARYGLTDIGKGEKVLVEFVSANPTGPLHVGHGRGAAVGDALSNLLAAMGYDVHREFYINDAGRQIALLARSVHARYQQTLGNDVPFPEDGYHGSYIEEIAKGLINIHGNKFLKVSLEECGSVFADYGKDTMLAEIKADLETFGVRFETWFSEKSLLADGSVRKSIEELKERG